MFEEEDKLPEVLLKARAHFVREPLEEICTSVSRGCCCTNHQGTEEDTGVHTEDLLRLKIEK